MAAAQRFILHRTRTTVESTSCIPSSEILLSLRMDSSAISD